MKRKYRTKHDWFGEKLTCQEIADRYGLHRVTVTTYFRTYKTPERILARIKEVKDPDFKHSSCGKFKEVTGMGKRKELESIPSPTEYERRLWGQ